MTSRCKLLSSLLLVALLQLLGGCASLSYYSQSIAGQVEVMTRQEKIKTILQREDTPVSLRQRLLLINEIRDFSITHLKLPDNPSYRYYADLQRPYVVWTLFATDPYSLQPRQWCFLVVGCLNYRGYFSKKDALNKLQQLQEDGLDVYIGGVSAYSTLGWFSDPVLNTILNRSDAELARVIFHELAHQQLYIENDSDFNESFADAVATIGVRRWLEHKANDDALHDFQHKQQGEKRFSRLVMNYQVKFQKLYSSGFNKESMEINKQRLYTAMKNDYRELVTKGELEGYDNWFDTGLNNAKLASVITYRRYVDDMLAIYEKISQNMSFFYDIIERISRCGPQQRETLLRLNTVSITC